MISRSIKGLFYIVFLVLFFRCSKLTGPSEGEPQQWVAANVNLPELTTVNAIASEPSQETVYIGTFTGVYKAAQEKENWLSMDQGFGNAEISCLALDSHSIYAGSWGNGVFAMPEPGSTWRMIWPSSHNPFINDLVVSPDNTLWVATQQGLFKSVDGGQSWEHSFTYGKILAIGLHPRKNKTLYIGALWHGIFRSSDAGQSWQQLYDETDPQGQLTEGATSFVFDPNEDNRILITTESGKVQSTVDGGQHWTRIADGLPDDDMLKIVAHPSQPLTIWGIMAKSGVYRSLDFGASWKPVQQGLDDVKAKSIHIALNNPNRVYLGTVADGIYEYVVGQ